VIYPVVHKVAVKLYVEDFGIDATLKTYERLFAILTSDGTIREDQFNLTGRMFAPKGASYDCPVCSALEARARVRRTVGLNHFGQRNLKY
jgi:hypothetical protein